VLRADNLTTFRCRLSWYLGASTSWNPLGLSRPLMVLLYLYLNVLITRVRYVYKYNIAIKAVLVLVICTFGTHMKAKNYTGEWRWITHVRTHVSWLWSGMKWRGFSSHLLEVCKNLVSSASYLVGNGLFGFGM